MVSQIRATRIRRGLTGPVILITLGSLFLLDQVVPGWGFGKTWPLLLVVVGVVRLIDVTQPPEPPRGPNP